MNQIPNQQDNSTKLLKKNVSWIIIGLTLIMGGAAVYRLGFADTSVTDTPVQTMPKITTVTALGRLEPQGEIIEVSVSSAAQGNQIEQLLVQLGDEVRKGEMVAVLDSRDRLEALLNQAQEQVKLAEANLALVKAGAKTGEIQAQQAAIARIEAERSNNIMAQNALVSRIQAELSNAELEYQRYSTLYQDGAVSASDKDRKYLTLATAREQLAEAQANLKGIESTQHKQIAEAQATLDKIAEIRPVDIAIAEAEINQAEAAVKIAQADLAKVYIKSPQTGRIMKILTRPGEVVASNEGIVRIGQIEQMYAIAEVYQSDIGKIKLGQSATISSHAIEQKLTGKVEQIGLEVERQEVVNTDPTANIDAKVIEVKIRLDPESSNYVKGLSNLLVNVQINL